MAAIRLGIDFGTSNSAAATYKDGQLSRVALEAGAETRNVRRHLGRFHGPCPTLIHEKTRASARVQRGR
jgi:molecular chaperone DnaK (HSP70)